MQLIPGCPESRYEFYGLPFSPSEAQLRGAPDPTSWISRLFGLDAEEVLRVLADDTKTIRHPSVARFRDSLLKFEPVALTHDNQHWSLAMDRKQSNPQSNYCTDTLYIESPHDPAMLDTMLSKYPFADRELFEEFYRHFYGVSGSPVEVAPSGFVRPEKWVIFESYGWEDQVKEADPGRRWARSIVIYETGAGQSVLLDPVAGDTAWAVLQTMKIVPFTSSFATVLDMCVDAAEDGYLAVDFWEWHRQRRS